MEYKYFKCSVETQDEYRSAGFILKNNKKDSIDKIQKFFKRNSWIKYDGVFLPLRECASLSNLENLNYVFQESIFGFKRVFY